MERGPASRRKNEGSREIGTDKLPIAVISIPPQPHIRYIDINVVFLYRVSMIPLDRSGHRHATEILSGRFRFTEQFVERSDRLIHLAFRNDIRWQKTKHDVMRAIDQHTLFNSVTHDLFARNS